MKATRLPSGNYRCIAYLGTDEDGKRIQKSFTAPTEKRAVALASAYENQFKNKVNRNSLSSALDAFISSKQAVLSPTTIRDYKNRIKTLKEHYPPLVKKSLIAITSNDLQDLVTDLMQPHQYHRLTKSAKGASPKTVRNYVNLLSAVFKANGVLMPPVVLPQKERADIYVPTVKEVERLLAAAKGTPMYVPVALAAFGPLRRGEICALTYPDDFQGDTVHVHASVALNDRNEWVVKPPKSFSSDRRIELPDWIIEAIKEQGGVTDLNPREMSARFEHLLKAADLPLFRFHDLRHFCVSYLHSIGVPDVYIIKRTGHNGDEILKRVYRHTMADHEKMYADKVRDAFSEFSDGV